MGNSSGILSTYDIGRIRTDIGFFKTLFRMHDVSLKHCLPAIVKKYDRQTGIAKVLPLVKVLHETQSGRTESDRPEYEVPVMRFCHGGFTIDAPIFVGDTGWIIAGDRNPATAIKENAVEVLEDQKEDDKNGNSGPQAPDTYDTADFAWGFFVPCFWGKYETSSEDGLVVKFTPSKESDDKKIAINIGKEGVLIERGDSDKLFLNDEGLKYEGEPDREQQVVTDVRYDMGLHQLQKKFVIQKIRGDFVVGVSEESDWTCIDGGQAVPEKTS